MFKSYIKTLDKSVRRNWCCFQYVRLYKNNLKGNGLLKQTDYYGKIKCEGCLRSSYLSVYHSDLKREILLGKDVRCIQMRHGIGNVTESNFICSLNLNMQQIFCYLHMKKI